MATTAKSGFLQGVVDGLPFILIGVPFATLFGVVAEAAGMNLAQILAMSALVIAGASQFTALQMMSDAAPVWLVLAAALTVNLRMAMYSAALQPHLGKAPLGQRILLAYLNVDSSFALGVQKFESENMTLSAKVAYFLGTMVIMAPLWVIFSWVGAVAGAQIYDYVSLDFAMPILFLALTAPMLKSLAHLSAAITSVIAALLLSFLPSGIGLMLAAVLAMMVGAEVERRMAP